MKTQKLNNGVLMHINPVYQKGYPVMALSFKKEKENGRFVGVVREIVKREGDVAVPGFLDRSKLFIVDSEDGLVWERKDELKIKGIKEIIDRCDLGGDKFIGLEDPSIWAEKGKVHVYFTIAYRLVNKPCYNIYLGHAEGSDLGNLNATEPVMSPNENDGYGFKEAAISPLSYMGERINLVEGVHIEKDMVGELSTIVAAVAKDIGKPWKLLKTVADPNKMKYGWCKGHLSPGVIFEPDFIKHGGLLVGILNGRSPEIYENGRKIFGKFRVGLMLFNPKTGEIPWISPEPLIDDPDARTITFASDFLRQGKKGILYAHVDDSFIRAYEIDAREIEKMLPRNKNN